MKKKFYNCYSTNMMVFFTENKVLPINMLFHDRTKKRIWIYELNHNFSKLLIQWSLNRNLQQ